EERRVLVPLGVVVRQRGLQRRGHRVHVAGGEVPAHPARGTGGRVELVERGRDVDAHDPSVPSTLGSGGRTHRRGHAAAAGATLLSEVETNPYGRSYRVEDLEGHRWMF